jgi:hypothetical protein
VAGRGEVVKTMKESPASLRTKDLRVSGTGRDGTGRDGTGRDALSTYGICQMPDGLEPPRLHPAKGPGWPAPGDFTQRQASCGPGKEKATRWLAQESLQSEAGCTAGLLTPLLNGCLRNGLREGESVVSGSH